MRQSIFKKTLIVLNGLVRESRSVVRTSKNKARKWFTEIHQYLEEINLLHLLDALLEYLMAIKVYFSCAQKQEKYWPSKELNMFIA